MSAGLYSGVSGLALGVGLYKGVSGLWGGANGLIAGFGGDGSTLSLNFINAVYEAAMTTYNFQQIINFTRTSSGTFVGSNGLIQNTPQSVNLLTFTQQLDVATAWGNSITGTGVAPTVTANDGTAPDGTPTADRLQFSLGGGTASGDVTRRRQAITTPATLQTFSMYLRSYDGVSTYNMHLVDAAGATRNIVVTGAWQRFEVTATGTGASVSFAVGLRGAQTPANSDTADVLAWGAQVEEAATASTYTRNVGGLFPARFDYDPITLQPRGILIEEQRTNLLLRSQEFGTGWAPVSTTVTSDTTVAPDGTTTADTLTASTTGSYVRQLAVFTGDGSKSYSVFVKAGTSTVTRLALRDTTVSTNRGTIDLTWTAGVPAGVALNGTLQGIDAYPNGWYRVRMLATNVVAAQNNEFRFSPDTSDGTGSVIMWGAQAENGAFATSYIPTVASQVTRTADQASIEAPMFAPWYNATEGAFVVQFSPTVEDNDIPFSISASGGYGNSIYANADSAFQFAVVVANVAQSLDAGTITAGATNSIAAAYKLDDFAVAVNGGAAATSTSGPIPTVDRASIGGLANNTLNRLNGVIRSIKYYPTRLSDAQLQALSV